MDILNPDLRWLLTEMLPDGALVTLCNESSIFNNLCYFDEKSTLQIQEVLKEKIIDNINETYSLFLLDGPILIEELNLNYDNDEFLHSSLLSSINITDEIIKILSQYLINNNTLEYLDLSDNNITDLGFKYLAKLLTINSSIKILDISYNRCTYIGAYGIAESLKVNKTLEELDISNNIIGNDEHNNVFLIDMLEFNNTIKELNLSDNNITYNNLIDIGNIENNTSLKNLNMSENSIGDIGLVNLSKIVKNKELEILNLSNNNIGSDGIKSLINTIIDMCKDVNINFSCGTLDCDPVQYLDLSNNYLDYSGTQIIKSAIKENIRINSLDLQNTNITNIDKKIIMKQYRESKIEYDDEYDSQYLSEIIF